MAARSSQPDSAATHPARAMARARPRAPRSNGLLNGRLPTLQQARKAKAPMLSPGLLQSIDSCLQVVVQSHLDSVHAVEVVVPARSCVARFQVVVDAEEILALPWNYGLDNSFIGGSTPGYNW